MTEVLTRKPGRPSLSTEILMERRKAGGLCSRCKERKQVSEFGFDGSRHPLFIKSRCKTCEKEYQAEYRKKNAKSKKQKDAKYYRLNQDAIKERVTEYKLENKEAILEAARNYARKRYQEQPEHMAMLRHKRRADLAGVSYVAFTLDEFNARMSMFDFMCWICKTGKFETVDHVKPISKGGAHMLANLRPCCKSCNSSKRASWPFKVGDAK